MDLLKLECHLWAVDPEVKGEGPVVKAQACLETPAALMVSTVGDNLPEEDREEKEAEEVVKVKRLYLTLVTA